MVHDNPLIERVHQATRLAHRRLEPQVDIYRPNFDIHDYRRILEDFWGFYQPLERKLAVLTDHIFPSLYSRERYKAPYLEQDLLSLGMAEADIAALPLCGRLPALPTLPQAFGVLYVIDGAVLGRRIATTHLADILGISSSQGGSFFSSLSSSYNVPINSSWQEFIAMTATMENPDHQDLVIQSAVDTFECLETWLDHQKRSPRTNSMRRDSLRWSAQLEPELFCAERLGDIRVA